MQVQILVSIAGETFGLAPGDIVERDAATASAWCASGVARPLDSIDDLRAETAMRAAAPERAARPRARGRR